MQELNAFLLQSDLQVIVQEKHLTFAIQVIHTLFNVFNNQDCLAVLYRNPDPDKM